MCDWFIGNFMWLCAFSVFLLLALFIFIYATYRFIIRDYLRQPKSLAFDEAKNIVLQIINLELDIYENDVFDKQETLSNAQYENFLEDIVTRIDNALTPELINSMKVYMTEAEIYTWIIRVVRRYFDDKAVIDDIPDDEDDLEKESGFM